MTSLSESSMSHGRVFNIGDIQEIPILNLARKVASMAALEEENYNELEDRIAFIPYDEAYTEGFEDMQRWVPHVSRINQTVGWESDCQFENILNDVKYDIRKSR